MKLAQKIIKQHYNYLSECEKIDTNQEKNIACSIVKYKEIEANREILSEYYKNNIEEREKMYKFSNLVLNKAIEKGDVQMAEMAMIMLKITHKKNIF